MTGVYIADGRTRRLANLDCPDVESLIGLVVKPAIADAGIFPSDVDAIFCGAL